jgi:hypothetical protein
MNDEDLLMGVCIAALLVVLLFVVRFAFGRHEGVFRVGGGCSYSESGSESPSCLLTATNIKGLTSPIPKIDKEAPIQTILYK